jgi:hypothetical protein
VTTAAALYEGRKTFNGLINYEEAKTKVRQKENRTTEKSGRRPFVSWQGQTSPLSQHIWTASHHTTFLQG